MVTCLLCPSPAVADGLCIECGAKKWWATLATSSPIAAGVVASSAQTNEARRRWPERVSAIRELSTPQDARAFLAKLDAARKARDEQVCGRGCKSHEEER